MILCIFLALGGGCGFFLLVLRLFFGVLGCHENEGPSFAISGPQFLGKFNQARIKVLVKASQHVFDGESHLIVVVFLHFGNFAVTSRTIDAAANKKVKQT